MTAPELAGVETFRLVAFDFDASSNVARFDYAFDDRHSFREVVEFGGQPLGSHAGAGIERALRLVHLAAGVSYYKAAAPGTILIETGPLSPAESGFVHDLYDKGMREFAVTNGLPVPLRFEIQAGTGPALATASAQEAPSPGIAVPVGGGKDSIVLIEALKQAGPPPGLEVRLVAINRHPAMQRTADVSGFKLASINRTLSPRLHELNAAGALNGHVPITAIVSLIVVAAGYVHGYDTTLVALERSADEATSLVDDVAVNHQWSKSTECELALRSVLRESVSRSIEYASPLRSCGELEIARWFAELEAYHGSFRSCNRVFRSGAAFDGWCRECPKCRFVFLVMAPFLEPDRLVAIFGRQPSRRPRAGRGFQGPVRRRTQALRVRRRAARVPARISPPSRPAGVARRCGGRCAPGRARGEPQPRRRRPRTWRPGARTSRRHPRARREVHRARAESRAQRAGHAAYDRADRVVSPA